MHNTILDPKESITMENENGRYGYANVIPRNADHPNSDSTCDLAGYRSCVTQPGGRNPIHPVVFVASQVVSL